MTLEPNFEGDFTIATDAPFTLELGGALQSVTLHYSIYGTLNEQRDNAVLVCHALSGSSRIADWWADMFGEHGAFDTERYCFICANLIGSCYGSTGPSSINPSTGQPYGPDFPLVTVGDSVRAQSLLMDHLGIKRLNAVLGGSIGGMQAIRWAIDYPERVANCIGIGTCELPAMGLALNHLQRQAIMNDPAYNGGRYTEQPAQGLSMARQIAMCSYKSAYLFTERYHRKPNRDGEDPYRSLNERFDVAGYLDHQGEKFLNRFDANSYLIITRIMETFDLPRTYGSYEAAFERIRARVLLIGISSDWLFPPEDIEALAGRMKQAGVDCEYKVLYSAHGHDGFLADPDQLTALLKPALRECAACAQAQGN